MVIKTATRIKQAKKLKGNSEKDFFIFGDSNTQGFWDSKGGWATRLKQYFDEWMAISPKFPKHGFYYMVYPLGITDDTTKKILERFEFEAGKRMAWGTTEEIFIFQIGKNDTAFLNIGESEKNIEEIIKRAKRFSNRIFFLEVAPVNERFTRPVAWDKKCFYDNKKITRFNKMLNKVAIKNGAKVIHIFEAWRKIDYKKMLADGVHPNDKGHEYIFRKVKDFLLKIF